MPSLTTTQEEAVVAAWLATGNVREVGRRTGVCYRAVARLLEIRGLRERRWRAAQVSPPADPAQPPESAKSPPAPAADWKVKDGGNEATVGLYAREPITSLEDLVRRAPIDTTTWDVVDWECTAWNVMHKDKAHDAHLHQLWRVSAKLRRIAPRPYMDALEALFAKYEARAPIYAPVPYRRGGRVMLEFDFSDAHFGKMAWAAETGQNYDLRIAERIFADAVEELLAETAHLKVEQIVVPFGNDYLHVDSLRNTTTAGTPVDTDGRFAKIVEIAEESFIRALDRFRGVAPVKVLWIPGNHDEQNSYMMARTVKAWFRNDRSVEVDVSPSGRKYHLYGATLIGYEHGDNLTDAQVRDLPAVMLQEAPKDFIAASRFHEWHIGHRHSERKFTTRDVDTHVGTVTRYMHSISATDAWHHRKKFVGSRRAAEVYWYDKEAGYKGHALALASCPPPGGVAA